MRALLRPRVLHSLLGPLVGAVVVSGIFSVLVGGWGDPVLLVAPVWAGLFALWTCWVSALLAAGISARLLVVLSPGRSR